MKDSDIIKQFREGLPQAMYDVEKFMLHILHQYRQEVIERVKALAYSETEDMTATEFLIMDSYNNAIKDVVSNIEALLKVKE